MLKIDIAALLFVDISGISKGKGFQGVMKRHNFRGLEASHGVQRKHRSAGSIGGGGINLGTGPKVKKGKKMAGQMGNKTAKERKLKIVRVDAENKCILVKGSVPGKPGGLLRITPAKIVGKNV